MRLLELVFLASLALSAIALFIAPAKRPGFLKYRPAVPITLALIHVFIDHGRWQLIVAYALAGIISLAAIFELRNKDGEAVDRAWLRWMAGLVILVVTAASTWLAWEVPVFTIPAPSGKYKVGDRWLALTDTTREETLSPEAGDKRVVIVRIWFPADTVGGAPDDYVEEDVARGIATGLHFPSFSFSHLPLVETHSYRRAWLPKGNERFPLLLFSHGYGVGTESQNTRQMEELASRGFVVASIDHPYEAGAILMPTGKVLLSNPPYQPFDSVAVRKVRAIGERARAATDTSAQRDALGAMYALSPALDTSIVRWTDDTRFVLDAITKMTAPHEGPDTLFVGRLETGRVGVFGMSFGGATAASFCIMDVRCVAGIDMDGLLYGVASREQLRRPFVWLSSQTNENIHTLFYERAGAPAYLITVNGAEHMDFTDFALVAPSLGRRVKFLGGIKPERTQALMNEVVVGFFEWTMRNGAPFDVNSLKAKFPEVEVKSRVGVSAPNAAGGVGLAPGAVGAASVLAPAQGAASDSDKR